MGCRRFKPPEPTRQDDQSKRIYMYFNIGISESVVNRNSNDNRDADDEEVKTKAKEPTPLKWKSNDSLSGRKPGGGGRTPMALVEDSYLSFGQPNKFYAASRNPKRGPGRGRSSSEEVPHRQYARYAETRERGRNEYNDRRYEDYQHYEPRERQRYQMSTNYHSTNRHEPRYDMYNERSVKSKARYEDYANYAPKPRKRYQTNSEDYKPYRKDSRYELHNERTARGTAGYQKYNQYQRCEYEDNERFAPKYIDSVERLSYNDRYDSSESLVLRQRHERRRPNYGYTVEQEFAIQPETRNPRNNNIGRNPYKANKYCSSFRNANLAETTKNQRMTEAAKSRKETLYNNSIYNELQVPVDAEDRRRSRRQSSGYEQYESSVTIPIDSIEPRRVTRSSANYKPRRNTPARSELAATRDSLVSFNDAPNAACIPCPYAKPTEVSRPAAHYAPTNHYSANVEPTTFAQVYNSAIPDRRPKFSEPQNASLRISPRDYVPISTVEENNDFNFNNSPSIKSNIANIEKRSSVRFLDYDIPTKQNSPYNVKEKSLCCRANITTSRLSNVSSGRSLYSSKSGHSRKSQSSLRTLPSRHDSCNLCRHPPRKSLKERLSGFFRKSKHCLGSGLFRCKPRMMKYQKPKPHCFPVHTQYYDWKYCDSVSKQKIPKSSKGCFYKVRKSASCLVTRNKRAASKSRKNLLAYVTLPREDKQLHHFTSNRKCRCPGMNYPTNYRETFKEEMIEYEPPSYPKFMRPSASYRSKVNTNDCQTSEISKCQSQFCSTVDELPPEDNISAVKTALRCCCSAYKDSMKSDAKLVDAPRSYSREFDAAPQNAPVQTQPYHNASDNDNCCRTMKKTASYNQAFHVAENLEDDEQKLAKSNSKNSSSTLIDRRSMTDAKLLCYCDNIAPTSADTRTSFVAGNNLIEELKSELIGKLKSEERLNAELQRQKPLPHAKIMQCIPESGSKMNPYSMPCICPCAPLDQACSAVCWQPAASNSFCPSGQYALQGL